MEKVILNGKKIAEKIRVNIKKEIEKRNLKPGLAAILVGKEPGSLIYVNLKEKAAEKMGIKFKKFSLDNKTSNKKIIELIKKINHNKLIDGVILQLPLPKHLNSNQLVGNISPLKDVDGFGPSTKFVSPVYQAVLKIIKETKINPKNKRAVILSKNRVFAEPLKKILEKKELKTKIIYFKKSLSLSEKKQIKIADFVAVAIGKPKFVRPEMIKKNAVIIDIGYNRVRGKAVGDADENITKKTPYLSPVPGGIGPLTVAYLLKNVYLSSKNKN